jgi:hypothetical protein
MAIDAYIGQPIVLQVVFLDPVTGSPVPVTGVNVTLFWYNTTTSVRTFLLNAVAMVAVTPADPSRYTYRYIIPDTIEDGTPLYVEYRGTDVALNVLVQSETLNAKSYPSDQGLRVRFVA